MKKQILIFLFGITSIAGIAQTTPSYVDTTGLIGWWPFTGNAIDSSGHGNNGTVYGATLTTDRFGNANCAYNFNGSSSYISTTNIVLKDTFSISVWVYPITNGPGAFVSKYDNVSSSVEFMYNNNPHSTGVGLDSGIYAEVGDAATVNNDVFANYKLTLNKWNHCVVTVSNGNADIYVNDTLVYSRTGLNPTNINSDILQFGKSVWGGNFVNGKLDDIGIWSRALTSCEIARLYHASNVVVSAGTITGSSTVTIGYPLTLSDTATGGTWSSSNTAIATVGSTGIVTGLTTGIDTIKYTVTNSCGSAIANKVVTVNPTTATLPCYVPSSGLIAWYPFSGNTVDSSGNGNNGINYGATLTTDRFGHANSAYDFNGSSYIATASITNAPLGHSPRSFSLWFRSNVISSPNNRDIFGWGSAPGGINGERFWFTLNYGLPYFCGQGTYDFYGTGFIGDGNWHNVVITYDSVNVNMYIDGVFNTTNPRSLNTVNSQIIFGQSPMGFGSGTTYLDGDLDDVGIWNRALSSCEISQLYNASCTPLTAGTITGSSTICAGSNTTLTDTTTSGTWSSASTGVVTVGSTGFVTGVSGGTATISYTTTNVCGSVSVTKTVTVNPIPTLTSVLSPASICSGTLFSYAPGSAVTGVTYAWSRALIPGISNPAGTGTGNVNETLINTTSAPIPVTYVYTLTASGCTNTQNVTVSVNPTPMLSGTLTPPAVCSGTLFTYTPTSPTTSATFAWSRALISGISNLAGTGTGNINETLINTTSAPIAVTYVYALSANGCVNLQNVTVTVNPLPDAGSISGASSVCVGSSITLIDGVAGGLWSASNGNAIVGPTGSLLGMVMGADTIVYTVTNTCGTVSATKTITINPLPNAGGITGAASVCVGSGASLSDTITGGLWSASNSNATVGLAGSLSGVTAGMDTIRYAVTNTCGTAIATKIITVNPLPAIGTITGPASVCTGSGITLTDGIASGIWNASNGNATVVSTGSLSSMVTGVVAGVDTIRYVVTNTCGTAIATKTIIINPLPSAGSISGPPGVCVAATALLTDAATGGVWSSSNATATAGSLSGGITGVSAGMDTIRYTVTNVCGTAMAARAITINPLPVAGIITGATSVCEGAAITLTDTTTSGTWSSSNATATVGPASSLSAIVTGLSAGTDTIKYSVTNTCGTATVSKIIIINPLPFAGVITGPPSVCTGATIILSDPVSGGVYSSANGSAFVSGSVVTGVSIGMDTLYYIVSNSCGTAVAMMTITVNPSPVAGVITGLDTVCMMRTIMLTDMVTGGVWSSSNGSATVSSAGLLSELVTGVYPNTDTIIYTVTNICGSASVMRPITILQTGACAADVNMVSNPVNAALKVYPNPNDGTFTMNLLSDIDEAVQVTVTNIIGQKVNEFTTTTNKTIDIKLDKASGIYTLSATTEHGNYVVKVVVE